MTDHVLCCCTICFVSSAIADNTNVELSAAQSQIGELTTKLESEREQSQAKLTLLLEAKGQIVDQFKSLANGILEEKAKRFTEQNQTNLSQMLDPLKTKIAEFQEKVESAYVNESKDRSALGAHGPDALQPRSQQMQPKVTSLITLVRQADWMIAWDGKQHVYLRNADLAFDGNGILFVGHGYKGPADRIIDGRSRMVMPGFVNIHCHPTSEPLQRGLTEERKSRKLGMSTIYEYLQLVGRSNKTKTLAESVDSKDPQIYEDSDTRSAAAKVAFSELMQSGVTTVVDYSPNRRNWLDEVAGIGIRACIAPSFRSAGWYTTNGHEVLYRWDEGAGRQAFEEAMRVLDAVKQHPCDRLFGMVAPGQIDTCTEDLLRDAKSAARERGLPMTLHAAQSVVEFREMMRRHGKTPIEWLAHLGLLDENFIVGHGIFLDHHSWLNWPDRNDLDRLANSGASVAHCPVQFVRGGVLLESFGEYRKRGINIGIGTDTFPHNFIDEMRWAIILAKVAQRDVDATSATDMYYCATVGGATALGRSDIGRLAKGCKADFVLADTSHPHLQPLRDPIRGIIFSALERPIRDVYIDGQQVVRDGKVLTIDIEKAAAALNEGQKRALVGVRERDWAKRTAEEAFPLALPMRERLH